MNEQLNKEIIRVTSPLVPPLEEFTSLLEDIWQRRWLTNDGEYHARLEQALADYLKVPYVSLFTNGTLPLITALQALGIKGEVITTPYSFVATTHALWWNGITPVFVDVDPETGCIDPNRIEEAITPQTSAILPVHVYGCPCRTEEIKQIADRHNLHVIYDAAHAFGVEINGESILNAGDLSTLSFHATKVFNTAEGGAMIMHDEATKRRIDHLKNFGFAGETEVVMPGINSKMDELRAAFGLLALKQVDEAIEARRRVAIAYRQALKNVDGIRFWDDRPGVRYNYGYFPIFVDAARRDGLYFRLQEHGIYGRRYFYPLISTFSPYSGLESATPQNLPVATRLADEVICLPIHHEMTEGDVQRVINCITGK